MPIDLVQICERVYIQNLATVSLDTVRNETMFYSIGLNDRWRPVKYNSLHLSVVNYTSVGLTLQNFKVI